MDYTVVRSDPSLPIQYCTDAMQNIIDQCITGGNYWGGRWSLNGFSYSIYNSIYDQNPNNPLMPQDAGGPAMVAGNPPTVGGNPSGGGPNNGSPGGGAPAPVPPPVAPGSPTSGTPNNNPNNDNNKCSTPVFGPPNADLYEGLQYPIPITPSPVKPAPAAQTVYMNGQICVLPAGSVDPACHPDPNAGGTSGGNSGGGTSGTGGTGSYPGCDASVNVTGFTCGGNCRGYVACPAWCVANCADCFKAGSVC
jgi:hypothetical protein